MLKFFHIIRKETAKNVPLNKNGNYTRYSVGELWTSPVGNVAPSRFAYYNPKHSISDFLKTVKTNLQTCSPSGQSELPEGEYDTDTKLISVSGKYVSVAKAYMLDIRGNPHPYFKVEWHIHQLLPSGLLNDKQVGISASINKSWHDFLLAISKHDPELAMYAQFGGFALVAGDNCVNAEMGYVIPPSGSINNSFQVKTTLELVDGKNAQSEKYQKEHPALIDWSHLDFTAVAPDLSGVVYINNHILYWQPTFGQVKKIANIEEIRGFQWINWDNLNAPAKELISSHQKNSNSRVNHGRR